MSTNAPPRQSRPEQALRAAVRRALPSTVSVATPEPLVALTFDDGPDERLTPAVLDVLDRAGVRATFFLVAERVRRSPDLGRRVRAAGHEIGLHGDRHVDMCGTGLRWQLAALRRGRRDLRELLGCDVRWFRPPYGHQDPETVAACRVAGMEPLLWSATAYDWRDLGIAEQLAQVGRGLRPGAVVLLHDGAARESDPPPPPPPTQPALLEHLLPLVARRGLRPVTASALCAAGRRVRGPWFEKWLQD